jgi:glycosyltransferase involved in cell wall biosynthesis
VLLITPAYLGGGMERCSRELFHALGRRDDIEPRLLVRRPSPRLAPGVFGVQRTIDRILEPITLLPGVHDWTHRTGMRFLRSLTTDVVDVVHLHSVVNTGLPIRGVSELTRRVPVIWTLHDEWAVTGGVSYDLSGFSDRRDRRRCSRHIGFERDTRVAFVSRRLRRFPIGPCTVVSPSRWLSACARDSGRFPGARLEVVRYGLTLLEDPSRGIPREEARRALSIPPGDRVALLIAATLGVAYKGFRHAIEALRQLAEPVRLRGRGGRATLAGTPSGRRHIGLDGHGPVSRLPGRGRDGDAEPGRQLSVRRSRVTSL